MVLKMLKGLKRLVLTTGMLCGVGLFLCAADVKAAETGVTVSGPDSDTGVYSVKFEPNPDNNTGYIITSVKIKNKGGATTIPCSITTSTVGKGTSTTPVEIATFKKSDIAQKGSELTLEPDKTAELIVSVEYSTKSGDTDPVPAGSPTESPKFFSDKLYKISVSKDVSKYDTAASPSYTITVGNDRTFSGTGYGFSGEKYSIKSTGVDGTKYYEYIGKSIIDCYAIEDETVKLKYLSAGSSWPATEGGWILADTDVAYLAEYFPVIGSVKIDKINSAALSEESKKIYLDKTGATKIDLAVSLEPVSGNDTDRTELNKAANSLGAMPNVGGLMTNFTNTAVGSYAYDASSKTSTYTITGGLTNPDSQGTVTTRFSVYYGTSGSGRIIDNYTNLTDEIVLTVYPHPTALTHAESTPITFKKSETKVIDITMLPKGVNQDKISDYVLDGAVVEKNGTTTTTLFTSKGFNISTKKLTLTSGATTGSTNIILTLKNTGDSADTISVTIPVSVIDIDPAKTATAVNGSNKNFITCGFALDMAQLIADNVKDGSGNAVKVDKSKITDIKVGDTNLGTDGLWKPTSPKLNNVVTCKIDGTEVASGAGMKVGAYPMPTLSYNTSARTLDAIIPSKVSTGLGDSNKIFEGTGFKLTLEDDNGNVLYEYADDKYKSVISGNTGKLSADYKVSASDVEAMITSAASNGKFSNDTTSVKFRIVPMGSGTKADSKVNNTASTTVYKITASGTNFATSYAYGLDGQTVSLVASPLSGYTFSKWSDGNTSNPRQIKISASGTRAFQAVAGERVDPNSSTGRTGGTGGDNSELYDNVPKTAESNSAIWLIVFMVFAVMGTAYALYLQLKAATSKNDK